MSFIAWIVLGLVAGWLAGLIMGGRRGLLGNIVLGVLGAIIGGSVGPVLFGWDVTGFNLGSILLATLGAILLVAILRAIPGAQPLEYLSCVQDRAEPHQAVVLRSRGRPALTKPGDQ